jgi:recombination protein RecR
VRIDYPPAIQRLVAQLKSLPGLGPRSAERLMLWLLQNAG